jgi:nucleotide-binding universal stress UspA family protein
MEEASRIVDSAGIRSTVRIELGVPYRTILKVADEQNVSLIVCGRERKGALDEIFFGSTTDKVVRYGSTPVYIPKCPDI